MCQRLKFGFVIFFFVVRYTAARNVPVRLAIHVPLKARRQDIRRRASVGNCIFRIIICINIYSKLDKITTNGIHSAK